MGGHMQRQMFPMSMMPPPGNMGGGQNVGNGGVNKHPHNHQQQNGNRRKNSSQQKHHGGKNNRGNRRNNTRRNRSNNHDGRNHHHRNNSYESGSNGGSNRRSRANSQSNYSKDILLSQDTPPIPVSADYDEDMKTYEPTHHRQRNKIETTKEKVLTTKTLVESDENTTGSVETKDSTGFVDAAETTNPPNLSLPTITATNTATASVEPIEIVNTELKNDEQKKKENGHQNNNQNNIISSSAKTEEAVSKKVVEFMDPEVISLNPDEIGDSFTAPTMPPSGFSSDKSDFFSPSWKDIAAETSRTEQKIVMNESINSVPTISHLSSNVENEIRSALDEQ